VKRAASKKVPRPSAVAAICAIGICYCMGLLAPGPAYADRPVRIGSTTYTGKKDRIWESLLTHLRIKLNSRCELVKADNITDVLNKFKSKEIDFGYLTPLDYVQAQRLAGVEGLAVQLRPDGSSGYYAVLVTKKSSGIKTMDQATGKKLAFAANDSVSGFKVQSFSLYRERNQAISKLFPQPVFAGTHFKVVEGLWKGTFEVGATNTKDLENSCKILGVKPDRFNIIWKSGLIPESVFVARKDLPPELKKAFAEALFEMNADKKELEALNIGGFAKPNAPDFKLIKDLDAYQQKNKIIY